MIIEKKDCLRGFIIGFLMFIIPIITICIESSNNIEITNGNMGQGRSSPAAVCLGVGVLIMYQ